MKHTEKPTPSQLVGLMVVLAWLTLAVLLRSGASAAMHPTESLSQPAVVASPPEIATHAPDEIEIDAGSKH